MCKHKKKPMKNHKIKKFMTNNFSCGNKIK